MCITSHFKQNILPARVRAFPEQARTSSSALCLSVIVIGKAGRVWWRVVAIVVASFGLVTTALALMGRGLAPKVVASGGEFSKINVWYRKTPLFKHPAPPDVYFSKMDTTRHHFWL